MKSQELEKLQSWEYKPGNFYIMVMFCPTCGRDIDMLQYMDVKTCCCGTKIRREGSMIYYEEKN